MLNQLGKGGAVYPLPAKNHLPFSVFKKKETGANNCYEA